jgi:hypothetical protein
MADRPNLTLITVPDATMEQKIAAHVERITDSLDVVRRNTRGINKELVEHALSACGSIIVVLGIANELDGRTLPHMARTKPDVGLLNWLIKHCEFHAADGYGVDELEVAPLWLNRAENLRRIIRQKYGVEPIGDDRGTTRSGRPAPSEEKA